MANVFGVYARFQRDGYETTQSAIDEREQMAKDFREYLWGADHESGLAGALRTLRSDSYGSDVNLILLQFNVNPLINSPFPEPKEIESYRPKEKSIGVWITITKENFFSKTDVEKDAFIRDVVVDRLEQVRARFNNRKLDVDMDRLIEDTKRLLGQ